MKPFTATTKNHSTSADKLTSLAEKINKQHRAAQQALSKGVAYALEAGKLLLQAKELIGHGGWGEWLKSNCPETERSAQIYMKMAREHQANPKRVSDLSLRDAIKLFVKGMPRPSEALFSSHSVEWYTLDEFLALVTEVLGQIDLDPCANPQKTVPAKQHFTKEDDGLAKSWSGTVFLNPPYGEGLENWISKLIEEHKQGKVIEAIALLPGHIESRWFALLRDYDRCHVQGNLKFRRGEGPNKGEETPAPHPSVAFYLGNDHRKFFRVFSRIGQVLRVLRSEEEAKKRLVLHRGERKVPAPEQRLAA
jgi:hypothetical protein